MKTFESFRQAAIERKGGEGPLQEAIGSYDYARDISKLTDEEVFALKTFEIYEELSTKDIPIEDIKYRVFKDSNGFLTAKFELTEQAKKELQMGSFVKIQSRDGNEGTTCDSKWSCGKAIYNCLENDQDALISEGECAGLQCYVTCQGLQ